MNMRDVYNPNRKKNIIFIGFMGSGKTTMGRNLSYKLRIPVEDTDKMIEKRENRSVAQIFEVKGEAYFREKETELLEEICNRNYGRIISVGGGTPILQKNRALLKQCGTVIYLRAKPESVYERLKSDATRPLLQCENPILRIRELMDERKACYEECADIIVDVDGVSKEDIMEELRKKLCDQGYEFKDTMRKCTKILVINGPNINFLGIREKNVYGNQDYQYLLELIAKKAEETETEIGVFQSNHEGAIIDRIQEAYFDGTRAIVINPGAYTHYSYAIRDALASISMPKVEIHISDITAREEFRRKSVTAPVCDKQIYGQGLDGYLQAIDFVLTAIQDKESQVMAEKL